MLCPWALFCKTVVMSPVTHEKHTQKQLKTFLISFLVLVVVQFTSSSSSPAGKYKSKISYLVEMLSFALSLIPVFVLFCVCTIFHYICTIYPCVSNTVCLCYLVFWGAVIALMQPSYKLLLGLSPCMLM